VSYGASCLDGVPDVPGFRSPTLDRRGRRDCWVPHDRDQRPRLPGLSCWPRASRSAYAERHDPAAPAVALAEAAPRGL